MPPLRYVPIATNSRAIYIFVKIKSPRNLHNGEEEYATLCFWWAELEQTDPLTKAWELEFLEVAFNANISAGARLYVNAGIQVLHTCTTIE